MTTAQYDDCTQRTKAMRRAPPFGQISVDLKDRDGHEGNDGQACATNNSRWQRTAAQPPRAKRAADASPAGLIHLNLPGLSIKDVWAEFPASRRPAAYEAGSLVVVNIGAGKQVGVATLLSVAPLFISTIFPDFKISLAHVRTVQPITTLLCGRRLRLPSAHHRIPRSRCIWRGYRSRIFCRTALCQPVGDQACARVLPRAEPPLGCRVGMKGRLTPG
jgi:hypothetical protein